MIEPVNGMQLVELYIVRGIINSYLKNHDVAINGMTKYECMEKLVFVYVNLVFQSELSDSGVFVGVRVDLRACVRVLVSICA